MTRLFVKICGITRAQDAELAGTLGAAALGFILWPDSPRCVTPETAGAIARRVPAHVMKVGVVVDQPLDQVARLAHHTGLDAIQLHGRETPEYCRALAALTRRTIIKSIPVAGDGPVSVPPFDPEVLLLVDAHDPQRRGGTGRTVNWHSAREIAATRPTILAGGLNAANIRLAVRSVHPYGVDVSSGVESAPGVKDPARLRTFFEALHD